MYIWVGRGLGDAPSSTPWRIRLGLRSKPQYLRFLNLDQFNWNEASLTPRLRQMIGHLAKHVQLSWKSMQPIGFIRLIGHTDNTGHEKYNIDLGDRRARAVKEELEDILKGRIRIAILVDPSPGASAPTADNRTREGRALNRRVEVFVAPPEPPPAPEPPPPPPPDFTKAVEAAAKRIEEEAAQRGYNRPVPTLPPGKSISERLDELLEGLPKWLARKIRNAVLSGACALLEMLFIQAGGQLREKDKEDLRKRCLEAAKTPIR